MATYYVRTSGNDTTGNGSLATPWLTITKANTTATSGDTVDIGAGTFAETLQVGKVSNVTYQGAGMFLTTITGNIFSSASVISILKNLKVSMTSLVSTVAYSINHNGVWVDGSTLSPVNSFHIFSLANGGTGATFTNSIYSSIRMNYTTTGFFVIYGGSGTIKSYDCTHYNMCERSGSILFYSYGVSSNLILKNNIFYGTSVGGMNIYDVYSVSGTVTHEYNYAYNMRQIGPSGLGTGEVSGVDPLLVDPAGGDFRLQSSSPCKGKGTSTLP